MLLSEQHARRHTDDHTAAVENKPVTNRRRERGVGGWWWGAEPSIFDVEYSEMYGRVG